MIAKNLSIIGLDRLGSSIALAIKASSFAVEVIGYEENRYILRDAQALNVVDKTENNLRKLVEKADILVLAVPYHTLKEMMPIIGDAFQEHCLVLDFSSLKGPGLKLAEKYMKQGHYVAASPVFAANRLFDGRNDVASASADEFKKSVFCLMPSPKANPEAVETAVNFGHLIGAVPYFVDVMEFDTLQTGVQTVPGLLAAALFSSVAKSTSWRDMLRFASVPFAMSTQPLAVNTDIAHEAIDNKIGTLRWLDGLIDELKLLRKQVYEGEEEILSATLAGLAGERDKWLSEREKNDWIEDDNTNIDINAGSIGFLGSFTQRGKRKKEE